VAAPLLRLESGRPTGIEPARNYSYAIQWWSFAGLTLVLFIVLNIEKRR
jgi:cytochrome oxidase assembly protein ShyY1